MLYRGPMKKKKIKITRDKATSYLKDLIGRAIETFYLPKEQVPYYATQMAVFGSYLNNEKDKLGDLDIFVKRECKWQDKREMVRYFANHPKNNARTYLQRMAYPEKIFCHHMINNSWAISLHDMEDMAIMNETYPDFKSFIFCEKEDLLQETNRWLNNLQNFKNYETTPVRTIDERIERLKTARDILNNI